MKAITVEPGKAGTRCFEDVPEPDLRDGSVLVEAVAVGVCGTDVEIAEGKYGWAPPGQARLVLGHESLGRVLDPGPSSLKKGDLVVGIVRRPDPVPCPACAVGEWDMCRNGEYTERGIKQIHGFMSERWRIEPEYAIKVDPSLGILGVLLEPMTVIAKALEQVVVRRASAPSGRRRRCSSPAPARSACWRRCGARLHGQGGPRPRPHARRASSRSSCATSGRRITPGASSTSTSTPDVIVECTGVGSVIADSIQKIGAGGVLCLTGVGGGGRSGYAVADVAAKVVLKNNVLVGSVNANKRHWYKASQALAEADRAWLGRLITRREKSGGLPEGAGENARRHQGRHPVLGDLAEHGRQRDDRWQRLNFRPPPPSDAPEPDQPVLVEYVSGGRVALITLNRPHADNAITTELAASLIEILETIAARTTVRVAVLAGPATEPSRSAATCGSARA